MKAIGELATEEYTYTGIYKLSNGQIPFITKKASLWFIWPTLKLGSRTLRSKSIKTR